MVVGGKFGLPLEFSKNETHPPFLDGNPYLLFNARSGIKLIVDSLKPKNLWIPSYLCHTIISAIDKKITKINFYPINSILEIVPSFINEVEPEDIFLYIDYFGFPTDQVFLDLLKSKGVILVHDCSQALFYNWRNSVADFCLYSPRKFLGVPDGGILFDINHLITRKPKLMEPPRQASYSMLQAVLKRREFDIWGGGYDWKDHFKEGEKLFTAGNHSMSEITKMLLEFAFDYSQIQSKRIENYSYLLNKLYILAIYHSLDNDVVPLGFPIRVKDRDLVQKKLFAKNIFPPIHWAIKEFVPEDFIESHELSNQIMTLPCDQRYGKRDMKHIADIVMESVI
jgi:dTDP-4-amino-4,6-dideoxygalactose transaminase